MTNIFIDIYTGDVDKPYKEIGKIKARVGAPSAFHKAPTRDQVNSKLREIALKKGANAVIKVEYYRGISPLSWKAHTATGIAVNMKKDEFRCPYCAEFINKEAIKCKHCGEKLVK